MADITEAEQWDNGVYQLETTDPVQGGADGVDNIPHKALANRTVWLKAQLALKSLLGGSGTQLFKAKAGVASDDVVNKGQLDLKIDLTTANSYDLGVGQTLVDETANRALGVTYTNSTGKPILVSVGSYTSDGVYNLGIMVSINSATPVRFGIDSTPSGYTSPSGTFLVEDGETYSVTTSSLTTLNFWSERK